LGCAVSTLRVNHDIPATAGLAAGRGCRDVAAILVVSVMPELPDVVVYIERLRAKLTGATLETVRVRSPSLLRTAEPPLATALGRHVLAFERIGKRIAMELEGELFLVLHLMIAGRLRWLARGAPLPGKLGQAAFDFDRGTLVLTEAGTRKRAQFHVVQGRAALAEHNRGGLEPLECDVAAFGEALRRENHTLKRVLTDPRIFSGIGNAYSDEILHRARLSPVKLSRKLDAQDTTRLWAACREVLNEWTEPNYCAHCQTGGKLLADRALSRLLRQDWPRTLEELEERMQSRRLK
jgi:formamidopyrimidine-DNA glycosylase